MIAWAVVDPGQAWHVQSFLNLESTACPQLRISTHVQFVYACTTPSYYHGTWRQCSTTELLKGRFWKQVNSSGFLRDVLGKLRLSLPLTCKIWWDRNTERKTAYCHQWIPTTWGALRSHAMGAGRCYPMCLTQSISFALSAANCAFHKTDVWKCSLLRITASPDS